MGIKRKLAVDFMTESEGVIHVRRTSIVLQAFPSSRAFSLELDSLSGAL